MVMPRVLPKERYLITNWISDTLRHSISTPCIEIRGGCDSKTTDTVRLILGRDVLALLIPLLKEFSVAVLSGLCLQYFRYSGAECEASNPDIYNSPLYISICRIYHELLVIPRIRGRFVYLRSNFCHPAKSTSSRKK